MGKMTNLELYDKYYDAPIDIFAKWVLWHSNKMLYKQFESLDKAFAGKIRSIADKYDSLCYECANLGTCAQMERMSLGKYLESLDYDTELIDWHLKADSIHDKYLAALKTPKRKECLDSYLHFIRERAFNEIITNTKTF